MYERKANDSSFNSLIKQDSQNFWKDWKMYCGCHNEASIISDYSSDAKVCDGFATSFKNNLRITIIFYIKIVNLLNVTKRIFKK